VVHPLAFLPALLALALALGTVGADARPPERDPRVVPPGRDRGAEPPPRAQRPARGVEPPGRSTGRPLYGTAPPRLQADDVGPDQAARAAGRASGGRVLGIGGQAPEYRVKVITEGGRVRTVRIDARTGEVLD
jgi:hypothetical protein